MKRHIEIERIDKGVIHDRTDLVTFRVKNQCVVFRPSKGEILGAVVTMVKKVTTFHLFLPFLLFAFLDCLYLFLLILFSSFFLISLILLIQRPRRQLL